MSQPTDATAAAVAVPSPYATYPRRPVPGAPVGLLGRTAQILLALQVPLLLALIVPTIHALRDTRLEERAGVTLQVAGASSDTVTALGVAWFALLLATGLVWITWIYRCRLNVDGWGSRLQTQSRRWVIAGWLFPLVSIWLGYRIVSDILDDTEADPRDEQAHHRRRPLVRAWGLAWAAANVAQLLRWPSVWVATVDLAVTAVAAVLAIVVCGQLTAAQTRRITAMNRDG